MALRQLSVSWRCRVVVARTTGGGREAVVVVVASAKPVPASVEARQYFNSEGGETCSSLSELVLTKGMGSVGAEHTLPCVSALSTDGFSSSSLTANDNILTKRLTS